MQSDLPSTYTLETDLNTLIILSQGQEKERFIHDKNISCVYICREQIPNNSESKNKSKKISEVHFMVLGDVKGSLLLFTYINEMKLISSTRLLFPIKKISFFDFQTDSLVFIDVLGNIRFLDKNDLRIIKGIISPVVSEDSEILLKRENNGFKILLDGCVSESWQMINERENLILTRIK